MLPGWLYQKVLVVYVTYVSILVYVVGHPRLVGLTAFVMAGLVYHAEHGKLHQW